MIQKYKNPSFIPFLLIVFFTCMQISCGSDSGNGSAQGQPVTPSGSQLLAPTNVRALPNNQEITLSWDNVDGASSYNIYWNKAGNVSKQDEKIVNVTSPYVHSNLFNTVTYFYRISAVSSGDESPLSSQVSAKANLPIYPAKPADIQLLPGNSQVTLSWYMQDGVYYNIYFNQSGEVSQSDNKIENVSSPYIHSGLTNGNAYYYKISALNAAGEVMSVSEFVAFPDAYTVYYVNATAIDDSGDGLSPAAAKKTINAAVEVATAPSLIYVATGAYYVYSESVGIFKPLVLKDKVSLYGHFSPDFTERHQSNSTSIIDGSAVNSNEIVPRTSATIIARDAISRATVVDGFRIYPSNIRSGNSATVIFCDSGNSPTIQGNVIYGGSGTLSGFAIYNLSASPLILSNTIFAQAGQVRAYGIYNEQAPSPIISFNSIDGGSSNNESTAIYSHQGSPLIRNNHIIGGNGKIVSYGIFNSESSPIVEHNTIDGGNSGQQSYGLWNTGLVSSSQIRYNDIHGGRGKSISCAIKELSSSKIYNNRLFGGQGDNSSGIYIGAGSDVALRNNTINGGSGAISAIGIDFDTSTTPSIDNNIILTSTADTSFSYCFYERPVDPTLVAAPLSVRNNDLFSCSIPYIDFDEACTTNLDGDNNNRTCTVEEMNNLTDLGPVLDNISVDPLFKNIDGFDNDINTLDDNDWHFSQPSPTTVTTGGLNGVNQGGWGFSDDKDHNPRPSTGINWSIGAYEP